jgi:serine/threonine-protein kinase
VDAADVLGGRYRLEERLGEGGMSVVWRAHDEVLRRPVAVKLLSARFLADWASRQRIRAEAQAVARLAHPHVAGVYDYGESERDDLERVPYVVMELLTGPSLAHVLASGPPPVPTALRICAEVASALAAAHEQGIVHRDVKPANVMLTATGAKVVDFGVAAAIGDLSEHHPDAVMYGTPAYLAPERLDGGPVVPGTDVYGLGLLLFRVLTGAMPWSAETTTQMLHAHMYVEPEPLPALPDVPRPVIAICQRCLAKDPDDRPTAATVARVLAKAAGLPVPLTDDDTSAPRSAGAIPTPFEAGAARNRRRAARLAVAAALVVSVTAVAIAASLRLSTANPGPDGPGALPAVVQPGGPDTAPSAGEGTGTAQAGEADPFGDDDGVERPGVDPRPPDQLPTSAAPAAPMTGGAGVQTPPSQPTVHTATFEATGGTALAQCTGAVAELLSWAPKEGWEVATAEAGPSSRGVRVTFHPTTSGAAQNRSIIRVRCVNGLPDGQAV